jgi:hypothetical protein
MTIDIRRLAAGGLAITAAFVGGWAVAAPHSFFVSFPLPGHHWVSALPAYNEHLTRDVGGLYLGLFAASAWTALRPRVESFRIVGASWLVFSVPHLLFHAEHLDVFSPGDAIGNALTLGLAVVLGGCLVWPSRQVDAVGRTRR